MSILTRRCLFWRKEAPGYCIVGAVLTMNLFVNGLLMKSEAYQAAEDRVNRALYVYSALVEEIRLERAY